ncbi:universal stress protein [Streptomyces sp. NPDC026672]|uniref:universal stress protein n=1 Tax=unclassified Streptomyces TaxID=2593676 RepID=UPI0033F52F6B
MTDRRVAVGVDGSPISVRALDWAAQEAVRREARLSVVYAVPDRDEAVPVLGAALSRARARHPGLALEAVAVESGAVRALVRAGESAALTVVGTRGFGGLAGRLLGSVSLGLAARARGPLAIVRGDGPPPGRSGALSAPPGPVLLGLTAATATVTCAYAFQDAERRGTALRVLHAVDPGTERTRADGTRADAPTRSALDRIRDLYPAVDLEGGTVPGTPARALLDASRAAAVVVVGAHHRPDGPRRCPGPVVRALLRRAHCPVVVVPSA